MVIDPDAGLVKGAKKGDKAAFGKLVNRYYEMVYVLAYGVVNNREAARDVTQEVFLKVYGMIGTFKGESKFKTWLHRVAINAAIDFSRKLRPTESLDVSEEDEESGRWPIVVSDPGFGPREQAIQTEKRVWVRQAMDQLTAEHRAVLLLREWEGLSYEEIAKVLQIGAGTVMSRLFYARKKLGEILKRRVSEESL